MADSQHGVLVEGSVSAALRKMAVPMAFGMIFMIAVNLIDTYWVARLGTEYVAAMTFTFPVVGLVINLVFGVMIGTSTAVARIVGQGDEAGARRVTGHALLLAIGLVILFSGVGLLSQEWLFSLLGAEGEVLTLAMTYMTIWYLGLVFLIVPLIINGVVRARGDARTPMVVMMLAAIVNAILDPILIFGWGPIPAMGFEGAAIATLVARFAGMVYIFTVIARRKGLIELSWPQWSAFWGSVKKIMSVGVPAAITNALGPLAVALITGIIAQYGPAALAAYGIGARLDALILMIPGALGGALSPFVGQNWGAHLRGRVAEGLRVSLRFGLLWGLGGCLLLIVSGPYIGRLFTSDPAVLADLTTYCQVIPIGYAFLSVSTIASSAFNAVDRAIRSTWLSLLRSLVIAVPAAYVGAMLDGLRGVFIGLVSASIIAAFFAARWLRTLLAPDGEISPEVGQSITPETARSVMKDPALGEFLGALLEPILTLEAMDARRLKNGIVGFFVGRRELAHIHPEGRIDLPLPIEIGENLVARGTVEHHPAHDDNGWYVHQIDDTRQVEETIWLLRLAHLLYEVSRRGIHDPITQDEMAAFTATDRCVAAMKASAKRWEPQSALLKTAAVQGDG